MSYCTEDDLIRRYGEKELIQLSNKDGNGTTLNVLVVAQAIADAEAEINGYLQGRYTLPLSSVPDALVAYACDIARYRLYDDNASEHVTDMYDDALAWLVMIAKGQTSLGIDQAGKSAAVSGGPASVGNQRVFDKATLKDFL